MAKIGTIELIASIDTAKYKQGEREISQSNKNLEGSASDVDKSFSHMSRNISRYSLVVVGAVATMFGAAVKGAADLEQNLGGSLAVFGDWSIDVEQMSTKAYQNMGLSASDYLQTINRMGSLLKGSGYTSQQAFDMSSEAMQRAADIASIMGIDVNFAMESIAGAAKGNFTMMDNLGVKMSAASIEAYALSKGVETTFDKMTESEKVGYAMQMFLENTAYAAGNYAKENDTLAGSFTTLKAAFGNMLAGVEGSGVRVADALGQMTSVLAERVPQIASQLAKNLTDMVLSLISGIDWGAIYAAIIPSESVRVGIQTVFQSLSGAVTSAWNVMRPMIDWFMTTLWPIITQVAGYVGGQLKGAWDSLSSSFEKMAPVLKVVGAIIGGLLVGVLIALVAAVVTVIAIVATLINWIAKVGEFFSTLWSIIYNGVVNVIKWAADFYNGVVRWFGQAWSSVQSIWGGAGGWFGGIINGIINFFAGIPGRIAGMFQAGWNAVLNINWAGLGASIVAGIAAGLNPGIIVGKMRDIASSALGAVKSFLGIHSPSRVMRDQVGKMIGAGLAEGIDASTRSAVSAATASSRAILGGFGDMSAGYSLSGTAALSGAVDTSSLGSSGRHTEYNINSIVISSEVDGERWLRKLTGNQEIVSSGLVPQQAYM